MPAELIRPGQISGVPLGEGLRGLVKSDPTEVTFSNSAAENTLYSYSVPGNNLGINDCLVAWLWCTLVNNSGGNLTYTMRMKFGGTTIATNSLTTVNFGATVFELDYRVMLKNTGVTNSQKGWAVMSLPGNASGGTPGALGTSAIDTTTAQSLVLTIQSSAATATQTIIQLWSWFAYLPKT